MMAWHVFDGDPSDGSLLIFATTRNGARSTAVNAGLWDFEYQHTTALRAPQWDSYATSAPAVVETNDDLPDQAPPFYDEGAF